MRCRQFQPTFDWKQSESQASATKTQAVTHQLKWVSAISYLAYYWHYIVYLLTVLLESNDGSHFQTHYVCSKHSSI